MSATCSDYLKPLAFLLLLVLVGCQPEPVERTPTEVALVEPATFRSWPTVTDKPIPISPEFAGLCRAPDPELAKREEESRKQHGPHNEQSIVVRVSPESFAAFQERQPLPVGAVVVKEKYADDEGKGPMTGYAIMVKHPAGYFPEGGDWEYAFIKLDDKRIETRGRLAECADCHSQVKSTDSLFRKYGKSNR